MSALVLLNLLNELKNRDKMRGLPRISSLFCNDFFFKFYNTGARMLDSIYHVALQLPKNLSFGVKTSRFCHLFRNVIRTSLRYIVPNL